MKRRILLAGKATLVAGLASGALVGAAGAAYAGGTSSTVMGCYATWGSTGANSHCYNVSDHLKFRTHGTCEGGPDQTSGWVELPKGGTSPNFGQVNCWYSIESAYTQNAKP